MEPSQMVIRLKAKARQAHEEESKANITGFNSSQKNGTQSQHEHSQFSPDKMHKTQLPPALQELLVPPPQEPEHVFVSFKPNPSARAYPFLPRYLARLGEGTPFDTTFKSFLEARRLYLDPEAEEILIFPNVVAPFGYQLRVASDTREVQILTRK